MSALCRYGCPSAVRLSKRDRVSKLIAGAMILARMRLCELLDGVAGEEPGARDAANVSDCSLRDKTRRRRVDQLVSRRNLALCRAFVNRGDRI